MRSIANELNTLRNNKKLLKQAIIDKGQKLADGDRFDTYPIRIDNISIGNKIFKTIDEMNAWTKADIGDIAVVYDEDTGDFEGVFEYTDKGYVLTKNQFTVKPEFVFSGTYYGPNGKAEGNMTEFKPSDFGGFCKFYDKLATSIKIEGNWKMNKQYYSRNLPPKLKMQITNKCTSMHEMFGRQYYGQSSLKSLDLSGSDTSNVTAMAGTFAGCGLTELNLSGFNTSKVSNFNDTFRGCWSLKTVDVSSFDMSNAEWFSDTFAESGITTLNTTNWVLNKARNTSEMFYKCSSLTELDVSNWGMASLESSGSMFSECSSLKALDVSKWNTSNLVNPRMMFHGCSSLEILDVSNWNTSKFTTLYAMFTNCLNLTSLDVSKWDTSKATDISRTFMLCKKLTSLDVSKWVTTKATDMSLLFQQCSKLKDIDISNWDLSNLKYMKNMFQYCSSLSETSLLSIAKAMTTIDPTKINTLVLGNSYHDSVGFTQTQANIIANSEYWETLSANGWTTGF